jgi:hypothetical protein
VQHGGSGTALQQQLDPHVARLVEHVARFVLHTIGGIKQFVGGLAFGTAQFISDAPGSVMAAWVAQAWRHALPVFATGVQALVVCARHSRTVGQWPVAVGPMPVSQVSRPLFATRPLPQVAGQSTSFDSLPPLAAGQQPSLVVPDGGSST